MGSEATGVDLLIDGLNRDHSQSFKVESYVHILICLLS